MDEEPHRETLRMIRRVTADGLLEFEELCQLGSYLNDNREARHSWPGNILWGTLQSVFEDGQVSAEELEAVGAMLADIEAECAANPDLNLTLYIRKVSRAEREAQKLPPSEPFVAPLLPGRIRREADAGREHEVNLELSSCDCEDWRRRRAALPVGHPGRICRCVAQAYAEALEEGLGADWPKPFVGMIRDLAGLFRGSDLAPDWRAVRIDERDYLIASGAGEWTHVHGPAVDADYDRFSYRRRDRSWFFGAQPPDAELIARFIDAMGDQASSQTSAAT